MNAPVIGITTKSLESLDGLVEPQPPSSVLGARYSEAVARAGGLPWPIPLLPDEPGLLRSVYERLDGLLIPGGADVRPSAYGAPPHPRLDRGEAERDLAEPTLLRWALRDGKPLLGICRGMQLINVACGGTLIQDIADEIPGAVKHDYFALRDYPRHLRVHSVRSVTGSAARRILGAFSVRVNSLHHQAVGRLGRGLVVGAVAPDGVVEVLDAPGYPFLLGVQWHPEELPGDPVMSRIFESFVDVASTWSAPGMARRFRGIRVAG